MNEFRVQQLSNRYDSTPGIPGAGVVTDFPDEDTSKCVMPDVYDPKPSTPGDIKKWRKSVTLEPSKIIIHPGMANDTDHLRIDTYGIKVPMGAKVEDLMAPDGGVSALMEERIQKKEANYHSHKREPLGQSYQRGHSIPAKHQELPFGKQTPHDVLGDNAKNLVYPEFNQEDEREYHDLYTKSHGQFNPGEQRRRGYDWQTTTGKLDPHAHRFGVQGGATASSAEGVARALNPATDPGILAPPKIVSQRLEDFLECDKEELGRVKNLGQGDRGLGDRHTFGMPSQRVPEWGTKQCMQGQYSQGEQQPDADLGMSVRPGWRNMTEEERPFGCPTLRRDIVAPAIKSIADNQNYGAEPNAENLLYPSRFTNMGVTEEDFLQPVGMEEVASIFGDSGMQLTQDELQMVYVEAQNLDPRGAVSIESFRRCMNVMLATGQLGMEVFSRSQQ